jgi:dipeptidyl-peptidase-4
MRALRAACLAASALVAVPGHASDGIPALDVRFRNAKAIAKQQWYTDNASLLDDVLWQPAGALIFRDRARGRYQRLDAVRWQFTPVVTFERLRQQLRSTGDVEERLVDEAIASPVRFQTSGVLLKAGDGYWSCDWTADRCSRHAPTLMDRAEVNRSPEGGAGMILDDGNLLLVSTAAPEGVQLTEDADESIVYGPKNRSGLLRRERFLQPRVAWSADGRYALISRLDQSAVPAASIVEWLPDGKFGARPRSFPVRDTYFGDATAGERALYLVDVTAQKLTRVPDAAAEYTADPVSAGFIHFSDDGRHVYIIREAPDFRSARLVEVDLKTLSSRVVLTEESPDRGFLYFSGQRNPAALHVFPRRNRLVWYSERGGFGHLYLYELRTGRLLRQLTRGPWTVASIVRVKGSEVYFVRTSGEDSAEPYDQHLNAIDIDTGRIRRLTDAGLDHAFSWPPGADFFVQSSSTIAVPATLTLRRIGSGARPPMQLGLRSHEASTGIRETGFRSPERFWIRSLIEGRTVFGTIFRPSWLTSRDKLPVIERIYPGYCCVMSPWSLPHQRGGRLSVPRFFEPQALAELGFVVVITAGPGSPLRGRAFHQAQKGEGYWDADSLETHMDVLRQLASRRPEIDLSRAGIYGHSGGGYAAARAVLKYPEFYKAAVALSGNHDRRLYGASWPAMYAGHDPHAPDALAGPETIALSGNLRGHLLLMHGDVDSDVLIDGTMQLAGALQRAGKKFDLQVIIGGPHGIDSNAYAQQYSWSYFLEHLRDERTNVDLAGY